MGALVRATPTGAVTARRLVFAACAALVFAWTAVVEFALGGESGSAAAPLAPQASVRVPGGGSATPATPASLAGRRASPNSGAPRRPPPTANDASDLAAAGPPAAGDPAVRRLAYRWCSAYLQWGRDPSRSRAQALAALSTARLYRSLAVRPPATAPARPAPGQQTVGDLELFGGGTGYTAIGDLRGDGADLAVELTIARTPRGLRVSALTL